MHLSVRDTGMGISADIQEKLFTKFTQADASTTRLYGGTGLGLAICKELTELMGGSIGLVSEKGIGSTFTVTLPLRLDPDPPKIEASAASLEGVRVLIVDDSDINRQVLHEQVTAWGMRTQLCASAEIALAVLEAAAADPFRVILVDFMMPGMDGLELARRIHDSPTQHSKIFLLSSSGQSISQSRRRDAGLTACIAKPIKSDYLRDILVKACGGALATPEKAEPAGQPASSPTLARRRHVLVVEDNAVNLAVVVAMLKKNDCDVDVAENGLVGVERSAAVDYDFILMDCHMPEMDGFDATSAIRQRDREGRRTPIIAMTALAMVGDRQRCLDAGMDDYIEKPIKQPILIKTIDRWSPPTAKDG
jgi:CheY-like chemotaxis protein